MQSEPMKAGGGDADVPDILSAAHAQYIAGRSADAERLCRQVLVLDSENASALYLLARLAYREQRMEDAERWLQRAILVRPEAAQYRFDHGACLLALRRLEDAAAEMRRGFALGAGDPGAWQTMAVILSDLGHAEEAEAAYRQAIDMNPAMGSAWYGLSRIKRFETDDPDIPAMLRTLERGDLAPRDRANLHFALGRAFEATADFDAAFDHYRHGNDIKRGFKPFDARAELVNARRIVRAFTPEIFAAARDAGNDSELPVFVVGMPRSGTTLVEQILDRHPAVHGAGEINDLWLTIAGAGKYLTHGLPEAIGAVPRDAWPRLAGSYLDKLRQHAPAASRIVDKLPFNYTLLGIIRLMLPRARIIHCTRDPLDTCVSCYTTSFGGDRGFTCAFEDLGAAYRAYRAMVDHWREVLPGGVFEVSYEALVKDVEAESRRMIEYLGLDWSETCLDFHRNPRAISTASHAQVREPPYQTSIGRWRRFERHLQPLRDALGDVLDDAGAR